MALKQPIPEKKDNTAAVAGGVAVGASLLGALAAALGSGGGGRRPGPRGRFGSPRAPAKSCNTPCGR